MSTTAQTRENIVALLENIIKRTELMERQSDSRNLLEVDLAMEDVRMLYLQLEVLRGQMSSQKPEAAPHVPARPEVMYEKPAPPKPVVSQNQENGKVDTPVPVERVTPEPVKEPRKEVVQERKPEPVAEKPAVKAEPAPAPPPAAVKAPEPVPENETPAKVAAPQKQVAVEQEPIRERRESAAPKAVVGETVVHGKTIVGEKFNAGKNSVHERLAQIKDDKSIAARMQEKPVGNIKEAIGINEKFLFINELFNGDLKAYNDSIEKLNTVPSIHEAFAFLNELTSEFQWDGQRSAQTIEKFANLVQRRHMES